MEDHEASAGMNSSAAAEQSDVQMNPERRYPVRNRRVRQGCPLSPYLFILSVEILDEAIRNKKEIKGIKIHNTEVKVSQYADDISKSVTVTDRSIWEHFSPKAEQ